MPNTTNYNWATPADTDLVKDGAAAIRTLGSSADTTVKNLNPGTTAGDIDYYTSSTAKARVAIGTAGQVLRVNSGGTAPEWATTADQTPLTTKGDLFTFTTVDARLGVGANGTVLTADSAEATGLKWATVSSGGYTLISTTTLTGNSVTISSIPTTYKHLFFTITNLDCSANDDFAIRFNGNTSSHYNVIDFGRGTAGTFATGGGFALDRIIYSDFCSNNAQIGTGEMFIANYTSTDASSKSITGHYMGKNTAGSALQRFASGYYAQTSAITSITVLGFGGATFDTGTITLYGVS